MQQGKKLDFDNMTLRERLSWRIKLWKMDHPFFGYESHWRILPPSYEYTHTPEECEAEKRRVVEEVRRILDGIEED